MAVQEDLPAADVPSLCLSGRLKEGVHSHHGGPLSSLKLPLVDLSRSSQGQSYRDVMSTVMGQGHIPYCHPGNLRISPNL